jgi:GTPase SAR1 family protein
MIQSEVFTRDAATQRVIEELKRLYKTKILPLEQTYQYAQFHQPYMSDAEFDSKPQVMLVGQYSVGKTSFIKYLVGRDFPGSRIGPEPTTDKFTAIFDGPEDQVIPGNALAVSNNMPFRGLEKFGMNFLNRFEGSQVQNCDALKFITIIDTPGILSGEKQRVARGYDFEQVAQWFAGRCDLILLLFDAHKLDISDELAKVILSLKSNDEKIRCILNKADQMDRQQLMRIYGALMWSLGKVVQTPEVLKVFVGSFWDGQLQNRDNAELFEMEHRDLMKDLKDLPRNSAVRKINELVKRVRAAKVHGYILSHLREQMPMLMGIETKKAELIKNMEREFKVVYKKYSLSHGDFPEINLFKSLLQEHDFKKFKPLNEKLMQDADHVLGVEFPRLMEALPRSNDFPGSNTVPTPRSNAGTAHAGMASSTPVATAMPLPPPRSVGGGGMPPSVPSSNSKAASIANDDSNPWANDDDTNPWDDSNEPEWALAAYVDTYKAEFDKLQTNGLIKGNVAVGAFGASGLTKPQLKKIWELSDVSRDGNLDLHEFVVAKYLIDMTKQGNAVPDQLEPNMLPPTK